MVFRGGSSPLEYPAAAASADAAPAAAWPGRDAASAGAARSLSAWLPSWPAVVGIAALVRAVAQPAALLHDPDTYLHIAAGRWMVAHHALPFHDPFSYSLPGAAWVPHEWLAELALAGVFDLFGWGGVVLLTALCFAAAAALLTRSLLRCGEPFVALILVLPSLGLVMPHLLARPHLLALPVMVAWCAAVTGARDAGRAPPLWLLPVMVLWANLHGGFMFGVALAGYFAVEAVLWPAPGETRAAAARRWGVFVAAALLAGLATPNGLSGVLQPFRLVAMPTLQAAIVEWQSPRLGDFPVLEAWILGALFCAFAFGLKLPLPRLVLALGLLYLTLAHVRHADLLAVAAPLAVAPAIARQAAARLRALPVSAVTRMVDRMALPAAPKTAAMALGLAALICVPVSLRPISRRDDLATPASALAAARANGLSGPVFNEYGFGGYLIFEGVPVFIDGRMEMYGDAFLKNYLAAHDGKEPALSALLDRYRIAWTLLSPDSGAALVLDHLPGWRRVYADRRAVVHARIGAAAPH